MAYMHVLHNQQEFVACLLEAGVCTDKALDRRAAIATQLLLQILLRLTDPMQVQLVSEIRQEHALQPHNNSVTSRWQPTNLLLSQDLDAYQPCKVLHVLSYDRSLRSWFYSLTPGQTLHRLAGGCTA